MNAKIMGDFIRKRRIELNLTQKDLAGKINVTDKAISKWECGYGFPDISIIEDLANALQIDVSELIKCKKVDNNIVIYKRFCYPHSRLTLKQRIVNSKILLVIITIFMCISGIYAFDDGSISVKPDSFVVTISDISLKDEYQTKSYNMLNLSYTLVDAEGNVISSGSLINSINHKCSIDDYEIKPGYTMYWYPTSDDSGFYSYNNTAVYIEVDTNMNGSKTIGLTGGGNSEVFSEKGTLTTLYTGSDNHFKFYIKNNSQTTLKIKGGDIKIKNSKTSKENL